MRPLSQLPFVKVLILLLLPHTLLGQDDDQSSGGSESAAEASVSGSASKKAIGAPESSESSPAINVAKAGLSISKILTTSTDELRAVTQSGSAAELKDVVNSINSGAADLKFIVKTAVKSKSSGGKIKLTEINQRAVVYNNAVKAGFTEDQLEDLENSLTNPNYDFDYAKESSNVNTAASGGAAAYYLLKRLDTETSLTSTQIDTTVKAYSNSLPTSDSALASFTTKLINGINNLLNLPGSRATLVHDAENSSQSTIDETDTIKLTEILVLKDPDILDAITQAVDTDARFGLFMLYHDLYESGATLSKEAVVNEINEFASLTNVIFTDVTLGGTNDLSKLQNITLKYIADKSPPKRLINYLAQYNILGFNNINGGENALVSALPSDLFSQDFTDKDVTYFAEYLATYTTVRDSETGALITEGRDLGDNDLNDYKIPLQNISLYPAKNITLSGDLDVSSVLPKATLSNNNVEPENIRVAIIGAANDVTISDNLLIKNDNEVEDHALVIAAADDLVVAQGKSIEYQGSNLALASGDTMWLVDVDIKAGGNIAIGTLNDLHLTSGSKITAGGGGNTSNKDLVLLYANDYLNINNVVFSEGIREIHLDAQRVAMRNMDLGNKFIRINTGSEIKWIIEGAFEINADSLITSDTVTSLTPGKKSVRLEKITHDLVAGGSRPVTNSDFSKVLPTN